MRTRVTRGIILRRFETRVPWKRRMICFASTAKCLSCVFLWQDITYGYAIIYFAKKAGGKHPQNRKEVSHETDTQDMFLAYENLESVGVTVGKGARWNFCLHRKSERDPLRQMSHGKGETIWTSSGKAGIKSLPVKLTPQKKKNFAEKVFALLEKHGFRYCRNPFNI